MEIQNKKISDIEQIKDKILLYFVSSKNSITYNYSNLQFKNSYNFFILIILTIFIKI